MIQSLYVDILGAYQYKNIMTKKNYLWTLQEQVLQKQQWLIL